MKCIRCGQEMQQDSVGKYRCPLCGQTMDDLVYRQPIVTTFENAVFPTNCLICGAEMVTNLVGTFFREAMVCDDCKKTIAWAKEKMKEKENETN